MKVYLKLDDAGYVRCWSSNYSDDDTKIDIDKDHEMLRNPEIFKYEDGELIKDEERQKQLIEEFNASENRLTDDEVNAIALMELTEIIMGGGE